MRLWDLIRTAHSSMPAQGCELNYQVRTKSGDVFGQLAAATIRFGLSQGRNSSQQHARTGGVKLLLRVNCTISGSD